MKNVLCISIMVLCFNIPIYGQTISITQKLSVIDSLLMRCDTTAIAAIILGDSSGIKYHSLFVSSDRDSIRSVYSSVLRAISSIPSHPIDKKREFAVQALNMEDQYYKQDAGDAACSMFTKFKTSYSNGDIDSALAFFYVARFLRNKYIIEGTAWLSANADSLETLIHKGESEIQASRQDLGVMNSFPDIDNANRRMDAYRIQDPQSPICQSISTELKARYNSLQIKLDNINRNRQVEQESDYKKVNFAFGVSLGGHLSLSEPYPTYTSEYIIGSSGPNPQTIRNTFRFQNELILAYFGSLDISYFIKSNLSIELSYGYAKGILTAASVPYNSGDVYNFFPKDDRTITYSSISCLANYFIRIKTGFRPLVGFGLIYCISYIPEVPLEQVNGINYVSDAKHSHSIRLAGRGGFEYISGKTSSFSYSLLIDISANMKSDQEVSPFMINPSIRISWLIP